MKTLDTDRPIIVIGGGGHGRVIADMVETLGIRFDGFLDDEPRVTNSRHKSQGPIRSLIPKFLSTHRFVVGIGHGPTRRALSEHILDQGGQLGTLVHPTAVVAADVEIGAGTVVMAGVLVNTGTQIGRFAVLNTGAIIDHDNLVEDNVHISPGVAQAGSVVCEEDSFIGVGASLIPGVRIGKGALVAGGAAVTSDVPPYTMVAGCPAIVKKRLPAP